MNEQEMLDRVRQNADTIKKHLQTAAEIGMTGAPNDNVPRLGPYGVDDPSTHEQIAKESTDEKS